MGRCRNFYKIWLAFIFAVGIVLRSFLYFKNPSLWGDEASLAINILNNSYLELFKGLSHLQAAPVGFTILEKFIIDLTKPKSMYMCDLLLRFIPYFAGIISIPFFYCLSKSVFGENKNSILLSLSLFVFNPAAVIYSAQLKQYSLELLLSIILIIVFYRLIVESEMKWTDVFIVSIIPWFSYSSFFIIFSGFAILLFRNIEFLKILVLPFILSVTVYYFLSLKSVFAVNYSGMDIYWKNAYAFMDFLHPMRFLVRTGELFVMTKFLAVFAGVIIFISYVFVYIQEKDLYKKLLWIGSLILVLIASMLHKYPYCARLILFLLPFFIIAMTSVRGWVGFLSKFMILGISLYSLFNFTPDAQEVCYSYAREAVSYLENNIKEDDVIVMDAEFSDYDVYFYRTNIKNKIVRLPVVCIKKDIDRCKAFVKDLEYKNYYFLSSSYYVKEVVGDMYEEPKLGFWPKKCKMVYVRK